MAESVITKKIWNIAGVLRDGGVSMSDYLEQLTYLLFLKMVDEDAQLPDELRWKNWEKIAMPKDCSWQQLASKSGKEQFDDYKNILDALSEKTGMLGEIYRGAQNKIQTPASLSNVIKMIDGISWIDLSEDVKGDIYEGLLEKIAQDTKSGAGQYFTPRPLIKTIVRCVNPTLGKTIIDPCCGSGGFLLAAKEYLKKDIANATEKQKEALSNSTFYGIEIVPNTFRLCLMNMLLHGIGEFGNDNLPIECKDSLANQPNQYFDFVMTNPPFGTKSSLTIEVEEKDKETGETITKTKKQNENYTRNDFITTTSNKQLNFVQHIKSLLKTNGTAAVVLPDNVLFEGGAGETIRQDLLKTCDLHTILRLPTGIFYAQGVKANVLFFEKKETTPLTQTKQVWVYDYRTNIKHTLKTNPLKESDLEDFITCYNPENRHKRSETFSPENPSGRWRKYSYNEIIARDKTSLDISWIKSGEDAVDYSLAELITLMEEKSQNILSAVTALKNIVENDQ